MSVDELSASLERVAVTGGLDRVHPNSFEMSILHGWNAAVVNRAARHWVDSHEPGARLSAVAAVPGCSTSARFTVIDLSAVGTPSDRVAAMIYMRDVCRQQHAVTRWHLFLVYDMHLVSSRSFLNMPWARIVGTTSRMDALSSTIRSAAVFIRVRCEVTVPAAIESLVAAAAAGGCVAAARKFAHEAIKTCVDAHITYAALLAARPDAADDLADIEHMAHLITRPVHALELAAIVAFGDGD